MVEYSVISVKVKRMTPYFRVSCGQVEQTAADALTGPILV